MLSFGLALAGRFDGVSGLDRERLARAGSDPADAMTAASAWVTSLAGAQRPVLVGYPVVFDWMFLHWYFVRFAGASPFGFSGALDLKTMYQQKAGVTLDAAGRDDLPGSLKPDARHTHHALDDAVEQAEIFARLFTWSSPGA